MISINTKHKLTAAAGIGAMVLAGVLLHSTSGQAQSTTTSTIDPVKALKGFQISPVPLNMQGKDPLMVGYGSYLVNGAGDCNGCHSAGPQTEYTPGSPYFTKPSGVVNPATYLGGGRDFGAFPDPAGNFPHIVSRNLTPDASGKPEGGNTLAQFIQIMRTGIDMDHVHPTCTGAPNGKCLPAPFNGDLLQIMPWPNFGNMTDDDLTAIYTYFSTIPCLEGGPGEPANRCVGAANTAKTTAVAGPKNATVITRQVQLDGTQSKSFDGKPLTYLWTIPQGSPQAGLSGSTTATPTVQFGTGRGTYMFQLTVTDSAGTTASDFVSVNFAGN